MENSEQLVDLLLRKFFNEELSQAEEDKLKEVIAGSEAHQVVYERLSKPGRIEELSKGYWSFIKNLKPVETPNPAKEENKEGKLVKGKFFGPLSIAASLFFVLGLGAYFYFTSSTKKPDHSSAKTSTEKPADLKPGQNKAVLTLADGKRIILDSTDIKLKQGNATITNKAGSISYDGKANAGHEVLYNTLSTGKGEIFSLALADGSNIWLNSASSIRYPVTFTGDERKVEITGEVYFEVAHNSAKPFKVFANGVQVEVLGTIFNINAYSEEPGIKTTLLQGKVLVKSETVNPKIAILKPGQQAEVKAGEINVSNDADVQQAIAWKNGYFQFNREDLKAVMRQLERWYDVDVIYEGEIPKREFWGKIHRNTMATEVLKILEGYKIHFRIEGKKIIVTP